MQETRRPHSDAARLASHEPLPPPVVCPDALGPSWPARRDGRAEKASACPDDPPMSAEPDAAAAAKAAGTAAFKAEDFEEAVRHFTLAIEADSTNHVLYSNRSAAYAKQQLYKQSLLDANKCIDLAPTWAKGHSRRGAAYVGLRNWRQAIVAYEEGLRLEPENAVMKEALASIQRKLAGGGSSTVVGGGPPSGMPVVPGADGTAALAVLTLLFTLVFFLPFLSVPLRDRCYQLALGTGLAGYAISLWRGWPKTMATLKDPRFLQSHEVQRAPLTLILLFSPPLPFALAPPATYALHRAVRLLASKAVSKLPGALRDRALWLLTEEGTHTTLAFAATSDLMTAISAPLTMLTHGFRAALISVVYAQHVAKSYHTSWYHRTAVEAVTQKLDGLMHHRRCPAILSSLYARVKGLVSSYPRRAAS